MWDIQYVCEDEFLIDQIEPDVWVEKVLDVPKEPIKDLQLIIVRLIWSKKGNKGEIAELKFALQLAKAYPGDDEREDKWWQHAAFWMI